jgi:adenosylhomocysteine nucleosidase
LGDRDATRAAVVLAAMPEELRPLRWLLTDPHPVTVGDVAMVTGRLHGQLVVLAVTGDGSRNARERAAAVLALAPARALLAIGVAGALSADLAPGDLVAVTRVVREHGPPLTASQQLIDVAARGARTGVAVTATRIADTVAEKQRLLAVARAGGDGAAVVDVESAAYAEAAIAARVPWMILRAISDTAFESLPTLLNRCRDHGGAVRRGLVFARLLREPLVLPRLLDLRRRVVACAEALAPAVARVIARSG